VTDHLDPNLTAWQIAARIFFSCAVAALVILAIYFTIGWLARQ
jgi:Tfp pilus assembly protein PilO